MNRKPKLIVMLTYDDYTVQNAADIFEECKNTPADIWGFKEQPLPLSDMQSLFARMKECGKTTALEVVAYDEPACIAGAETAVQCGADILMGTKFYASVAGICKEHGIQYTPFVGEVSGRPSVLNGDAESMIAEAQYALSHGADGIDLLGYRFAGDANALNRRLITELNAPVCIAGSIDSFARLDEVLSAGADSFTVGSALFDRKFGDTFREQIERICAYIDRFGTGANT